MNRLVAGYNNQNSILVVSSYPEEGIKYSGKVCAVGGYAKNTLLSLNEYFKENNEDRKIVVLTIKTGKEEIYIENGILVWRIFERNKPLSYFSLLKAVLKFNFIKDVLVEFEFASFGDSKTTSLFPFILLFLRGIGKDTVLVLHQVPSDLSLLTGHLGWEKTSIKVSIYNKIVQIFLFMLILSVNKVVVLEEMFKKRLVAMIGFKEKIHVIPHGIDRGINLPSRKLARSKLNIKTKEFVLLYFGYLTWYKGVDFLIQALASQKGTIGGKKIRLIVAGGESMTQKTKIHYRKFVDYIYALTNHSPQITITGFVPEQDIPQYFSAADLVVLPYRVFMSSSGPLSFAAAFNKPFIISSALEGYFESPDFSNCLKESGLRKEDIMFALKEKRFTEKLKFVMEPGRLSSLSTFSQLLAKRRDFRFLAPVYAKLFNNNRQKLLSPIFTPVTLLRSTV